MQHRSLAKVIDRLVAAGCVSAPDEARDLLAAGPDDDTLEAWIRRRESGEPLAWIIGTTDFCGHSIHVAPGVYVPRWQSEELAQRAAAVMPAVGGRAVDLCTGAGAIAVHLQSAAPAATVIGVDIDERAVRCARRNAVLAIVGDLGGPLRSGTFDVVTAVAPYVPTTDLALLPADVQRFEPALALDGGNDGLHVVRRALQSAARLLRAGGWFLTELGADQAETLTPQLDALGFVQASPWFDDDGDLRGLAAQSSRDTPTSG